jgi:hypothetical protein
VRRLVADGRLAGAVRAALGDRSEPERQPPEPAGRHQ